MSALNIRFHRGGVHLPELGLWLDPHETRTGPERAFVSHAHSDHIGAHREVILSEPTSKLMGAKLPGKRREHVLPFGRAVQFEGEGVPFSVTLYPAGHVLGSAMAHVAAGGGSLLYTGDFKLRRSLSSELCDPRPADSLIMETTFGRPEYRFPPAVEVLQAVIRFCRETLDDDTTPVLLAYSLGKSQELLCGLKDARLPIMVHSQIGKLSTIYEAFDCSFPPYEVFDPSTAQGKVVLCPPSAFGAAVMRSIGPVRTAILTGWAVDPRCRYRYKTDAAFPLSDHADFPDLIELVRQVAPKKVYTLHGFAAEFALTLREMGYDAQALNEEEQLTLPLKGENLGGERNEKRENRKSREMVRRSNRPTVPGPQPIQSLISEPVEPHRAFQTFAATCAEIGSTPRKIEKTRILAEYFRKLEASLLAPVSSWFTGHPFPPSQNRALHLGWALIRDAVCGAASIGQSEFGQVYLRHSDLGETAAEILLESSSAKPVLALSDVDTVFHQLFAARGSQGRLLILTKILRGCTALEAKYVVKILAGELRIGLKEGLVEEAIGRAFDVPVEEVRNANLIVGNIGETARLAKRGELHAAEVSPFRPVKFMLASPEQTGESVWKRARGWMHSGKGSGRGVCAEAQSGHTSPSEPEPGAAKNSDAILWIEDKYDGIRCQLHKVGARVALYSRDLKEMTSTFLELVDSAKTLADDFIIDGEILAMRGGRALPFADLQRRLGRKEADLFLSHEVPVCYVAFDLLWLGGKSYLNEPLRCRRAALKRLSHFELSKITPANSAVEIETAFSAAKHRGNEGLVIKDPSSDYLPGRRGLGWLKLKKAFGTLDCVVVGAEYGHGRRKSVLSDYTFAVRDETTGELKTIGKSFTGLTDREIAELTRQFLKLVVSDEGRYLKVEPRIVLEIAFDSIQISERHASGLALRFPRILRVRGDKAPDEIDTVATARRLLKSESRSRRG